MVLAGVGRDAAYVANQIDALSGEESYALAAGGVLRVTSDREAADMGVERDKTHRL